MASETDLHLQHLSMIVRTALDELWDVHMIIPAHHIGFCRYARLSDALAPYSDDSAAAFKP